eukprot:165998-Amphidinium_carterae.1
MSDDESASTHVFDCDLVAYHIAPHIPCSAPGKLPNENPHLARLLIHRSRRLKRKSMACFMKSREKPPLLAD